MSAPDFQTQLRLQLRDAARREERRSALALPTGWWRGLSPVIIAVAVTLLVLALVLAGLALRGPNPDRTAEPKAVERIPPIAGALGPVIGAFGSVWAVDPTGRLIQLDPTSRDVLTSFDVPARTGLVAGAGAVWVGDDKAIQRIDPRTGRAVARIPLRTPRGDSFVLSDLLFTDRYAWGVGDEGLLRIDLRRNRADRFVPVEGAGLIRGATLDGGVLWVIARSDTLQKFDPRTGARLGSVRVNWPPSVGLYSEHGVALTSSRLDGRIARVDLATGRELWVRDIGSRPGWWTVAGSDVWVQVSTGHGRDRLLRLDAGTGKVLSATELPDLGVTTMTVINGQVWVGTPNGTIDVVRIAPR
jgi:outer membrane protein assembly factor BamB